MRGGYEALPARAPFPVRTPWFIRFIRSNDPASRAFTDMIRTPSFLLIVVIPVFVGCVAVKPQPIALPAAHVIVGRHQTTAGDTYWRPSNEDIATLEAALSQLWIKPDKRVIVPGARAPLKNINRLLSDYVIQYHGRSWDGRRVIVGRAAYRHDPSSDKYLIVPPEREAVGSPFEVYTDFDVAGGGENFFEMTYDVESRSVLELRFNAGV
jgi:hypothetical protein